MVFVLFHTHFNVLFTTKTSRSYRVSWTKKMLWLGIAACSGGIVCFLWMKTTAPPPSLPGPMGTLVDAVTMADVVCLVRRLDRGLGMDDLAERLERTLKRFPPTDRVKQRLRSMLETVCGSRGEEEFCVVLMGTIANAIS